MSTLANVMNEDFFSLAELVPVNTDLEIATNDTISNFTEIRIQTKY